MGPGSFYIMPVEGAGTNVGFYPVLILSINRPIYLTLNIFYCSKRNTWIGHKFHNLVTSSLIYIACFNNVPKQLLR